ncbi:cell division protein FtsA [Spirochaetia bacterium]|nr:cell division protein FtsA [Spirochaetia bacterium]
MVVNIEATLRSVAAAIDAAEMMSGSEVKTVWTGIGGSHIDGINSRGVVAVTGKGREIGPSDIARVLEAARAVVIPMDRQILEVIPQSYIVDDQKGIRDPLDMMGVRLEAEVHIITCSGTSAQNLVKCVNRAGYEVNDLVLQSLAAGRSVLTEEEKELGVVLVDLGGGTTELLVYTEGTPYSITTIPAGGEQVTRDISIIKGISFENAEKIKIEAGCCWKTMLGTGAAGSPLEGDDDVIVPGVGGRPPMPIPRSQILTIIQPRMEEIFGMVKDELDRLNLSRPLGGGIVLTGGGAQLLGAAELANQIFKMPVRVGTPLSVGGLVEEYRSPVYAAAVGLVLEGNDREGKAGPDRSGGPSPRESAPDGIHKKFWNWIKGEFF